MPRIPESTRSSDMISLNDQYEFVASRSLDDKYRVNLGKKIIELLNDHFPFNSFNIYIGSDGNIILQPMNLVPASEQWIWRDPKIKASFARAIKDAREGKTTRVKDIDSFLESL